MQPLSIDIAIGVLIAAVIVGLFMGGMSLLAENERHGGGYAGAGCFMMILAVAAAAGLVLLRSGVIAFPH